MKFNHEHVFSDCRILNNLCFVAVNNAVTADVDISVGIFELL